MKPSRTPRMLSLLAAVLPLILTTGCGSAASPSASRTSLNTPATIADIEVILSTRGNALMTPYWQTSDQPDFDRTIAPGEPAFRAEEDAFWDNLRELPLQSVLYHPDLDSTGAARGATTSYEGGVPHLHLTVNEDIEFGTKPYFPVSIPVAMTFVDVQGSWYLSDEAEPASMATSAYVRPWFGGRTSAVIGNRTITIVDGTRATDALNLSVRIDSAISAEQHALGQTGSASPVLVDATANGRVAIGNSGALLLSNAAEPWLKETTYVLKLDPRRVASTQGESVLRAAMKDLLTAQTQGHVGGSSTKGPGD